MSTRLHDLNAVLFGGGRVTLVEGVTPAATTKSDVQTGFAGAAYLLLRCEARRPTGSDLALTITVEHSADGITWTTLATFAEIDAAGDAYLRTGPPLDRIRFSYALGGADSAAVRIEALAGLALPDASGASAGDLLTIGANGTPGWATPV